MRALCTFIQCSVLLYNTEKDLFDVRFAGINDSALLSPYFFLTFAIRMLYLQGHHVSLSSQYLSSSLDRLFKDASRCAAVPEFPDRCSISGCLSPAPSFRSDCCYSLLDQRYATFMRYMHLFGVVQVDVQLFFGRGSRHSLS